MENGIKRSNVENEADDMDFHVDASRLVSNGEEESQGVSSANDIFWDQLFLSETPSAADGELEQEFDLDSGIDSKEAGEVETVEASLEFLGDAEAKDWWPNKPGVESMPVSVG